MPIGARGRIDMVGRGEEREGQGANDGEDEPSRGLIAGHGFHGSCETSDFLAQGKVLGGVVQWVSSIRTSSMFFISAFSHWKVTRHGDLRESASIEYCHR